MELLKNWVMYVTGAAIISAVCLNIAPKGRGKKTAQLVCGLVTLLCLAYPVTAGKLQELEGFEFAYDEIEKFENDAEETERAVTRLVIEDEYEAYILDKGEDFGIEITEVDVSVRWNDEGYWYPVDVEIYAECDLETQNVFAQTICEELGISAENIHWS